MKAKCAANMVRWLSGAFLTICLVLPAQADEVAEPGASVAAEQALGTAKVLDIQAKVLDIVGLQRDVESKTSGVEAALADLGAKVTEKEIRIELSADVLFDFDKASLRPDAFEALRKAGDVIRNYANAPVLIEGHTDSKGSDQYNQSLSDKRAKSVKDWLVRNAGANARFIMTKGWGESRPAVANTKPDGSDDPEGRQKNRRVEITIKKG